MSEAVATSARNPLLLSPAAAARIIGSLLPLALLAGAFGSQYFGGLYPCEMCWWQRYAHIAALGFAALSFTAPAPSSRSRALTMLAALAIAAPEQQPVVDVPRELVQRLGHLPGVVGFDGLGAFGEHRCGQSGECDAIRRSRRRRSRATAASLRLSGNSKNR